VLSLMAMSPRLLRPRRRLTVPGAPTITSAAESFSVEWTTPSTGGSPLTGYRLYVNGSLSEFNEWATASVDSYSAGSLLQVSAVNAIGEGPKSPAFVATA
jgi:hypothetical protein